MASQASESRSEKRERRIEQKNQACEEILNKFVTDLTPDIRRLRSYKSDASRRIAFEINGAFTVVEDRYTVGIWKPRSLMAVSTDWKTLSVQATSVVTQDQVFFKARIELQAKLIAKEANICKLFRGGVHVVENLWHATEDTFREICADLSYNDITRLSTEVTDRIAGNINSRDHLPFTIGSFGLAHIEAVDQRVRDSLGNQLVYGRQRAEEAQKQDLERVRAEAELERVEAQSRIDQQKQEARAQVEQQKLETQGAMDEARRESEAAETRHKMVIWEETRKQREEEIKANYETATAEREHEIKLKEMELRFQVEQEKIRVEQERIKADAERANLEGQTKAFREKPTAQVVVPGAVPPP